MRIAAYNGISRSEIVAKRVTSEGKIYSLDHADALIVNMRYKGEGRANTNSQGWERSSTYYFREIQGKHPEIFSKKNTARIERGESPRVDACFVRSFPQYKGFENETLIHHHVGKGGQAVAIPQSIHKGSGEIHIYENELGITEYARNFSNKCKDICHRDAHMIGCTSDQFESFLKKRDNDRGPGRTNHSISRVIKNEHTRRNGSEMCATSINDNRANDKDTFLNTSLSQDKSRR